MLCIDFVLCLFKIQRMGNVCVRVCVCVFACKKRIISLAALSIFLQCFNLIWNGKWLWMVMRVSVKVNVNVNEYMSEGVRECVRLLFTLQSVICSMWQRWWWWFFTHHFPAHSNRLPFTMHIKYYVLNEGVARACVWVCVWQNTLCCRAREFYACMRIE